MYLRMYIRQNKISRWQIYSGTCVQLSEADGIEVPVLNLVCIC